MLNPSRVSLLSLALCCGIALGVEHSDEPAAQQSELSSRVMRAAASLDLQPGDERRIANAEPMVFRAVRGNNEFTGQLIVRCRPGAAHRANIRVAPLVERTSVFVPEHVVRVPAGVSEGELAAALMATGDYEFAEPNWRVFPIATEPNDPQVDNSWQHDRIQSRLAWDITTGSSSVIVAVCDSGVDLDHPDLEAALVPGFNSVRRRAQVDGGEVDDLNGHGTFVSGLAAAIGNNNRGVVGVGWDFGLMPIRVSNVSSGSAGTFNIHEGARWAAANGAKIANASYSGASNGSNDSAALDVKRLGGLLFWASGNDGSQLGGNDLKNLIVVGSTNSSDTRSGFSNFGPGVNVTAPGSSVRSTRRGGGYGNSSGTSYASPVAAGVGAMIFAANPLLGPDDVQDILYQSADDLGASGRDDFYGFGRVNTFNAVTLAQSYEPRTPLPVSTGFESASWQDLFETTSGSPATEVTPDAPDGSLALVLSGTDAVVTRMLAANPFREGDLVFRMSARSEGVETDDSLVAEYENEDGSWTTLFEVPGSGFDGSFQIQQETIPGEALRHSVRVRIRAEGSDSGDRWLVDAFEIGEPAANPVGYSEDFESGRLQTNRWSDPAGAEVVIDGSNFALEVDANDAPTTEQVALFEIGTFPVFTHFGVRAEGLGAGDELAIEYRAQGGDWTTLDTLDAADVGATRTSFQYELGFAVLVASDYQLRFVNSGSGRFLVDDVYIGEEALTEGGPCSVADLAEPFEELNFFDLGAFLTAFNAGEASADLADPIGVFNFFDLGAYLNAFNAGCP